MSVASLVPAAYAVRAKATRTQMHQDSDVLLESRNNKAYEVDLPTAIYFFANNATVNIWQRVKSELENKFSNKQNIIQNFEKLWVKMTKEVEKQWVSSSSNNNPKSSQPLEEIIKAQTTLDYLHKKWMKHLETTIDLVKKEVPLPQELKEQTDYIQWTKQKKKLLLNFRADASGFHNILLLWKEEMQKNSPSKMQMQYVLVMLYMIRDMIFPIFFTTCRKLQTAVRKLNPNEVARTVELPKVPQTIGYQKNNDTNLSSSHNGVPADYKLSQVQASLNKICTHVKPFNTSVAVKDWADIEKDWCIVYKYLLEYSYLFYKPQFSHPPDHDQIPPFPYDHMEWISPDLTKRYPFGATKAKLQLLLPAISTRFNHDQYCPSVSTAYLVAHEK